jgi:hypothetical protein
MASAMNWLVNLKAIAYPLRKADEEKRNNPASYYVYRRLSWPVTWVFLSLGVSPVQVTLVALALTLAGFVMLAAGHYVQGAVCLNLAYVLDQVDGNIARATKKTSPQGAWLDSMVGFLYSSFTLVIVSLGIWINSETKPLSSIFLPASVHPLPDTVLIWGLLGTLAITVRKASVSLAQGAPRPGAAGEHFSAQGGLFVIPKMLNSFSVLLLLVAALSRVLTEYVIIYSAYQLVLMCFVCLLTFRRLARSNSERKGL